MFWHTTRYEFLLLMKSLFLGTKQTQIKKVEAKLQVKLTYSNTITC